MAITVLLRCRNLDETRHFYRFNLHFNVFDFAEGTLTVERRDSRLIFTTADIWNNSIAFSGTIYFAVADVDNYFMSVRDKVEIAWPVQNMSYGSREFGIRDCNGYHLAFQQPA